MRRKTLYTTQEVDVEVDYDVDFDDLLEVIETCNKEQKEKIINTIVNSEGKEEHNKMKRLTLYNEQEVDVECEYDVYFDDIMDLINSCDSYEMEEIIDNIDSDLNGSILIKSDNLYDDQKVKLLKSAFNKFSLEELELRLK